MTDALTSRVIRELNAERDKQERVTAGARLAVLNTPPPGEADYGAHAPSAPLAEAAPGGEPSVLQVPIKFTPTPFTWRDPSTFPRRQFVYGRHYARQFLSVTAAQTKVGKSSLGLVEAVAMAAGRNLLGIEPIRPMRVWYWNGEDPQEELERRVLAICLHYGVDRRAVEEEPLSRQWSRH